MKAKKLAAILLTLVLALGLIPMGAMAAPRDVAADSTASITVNNAVENDVFAAYKVVDITYTAEDNNLKKAFNSDFAGYFSGKNTTIEQFAALKDEAHAQDLKNLLADLPKYIEDNKDSIASPATATAGADKSATFADLAMGEYFIRPTSTTSVYQLMLQKIEPTVDNGTYKIDDVAFDAKHEPVNVTKTANKTSVTKDETVDYTITVDIPTYLDEAKDKTFYVSDKLPDGLTIVTDSIKVKVGVTDVDAAAYTLDTPAIAGDYTFKLSVSNDQYANWKTNAGINPLVITYTATLNDNDTTEVNTKETNTVTFDHSYYPYVTSAGSHVQKTASVDVTTFAIKVDKFKAGEENTTKLANAKFDLYRTLYAGETGGVNIPHANVQGKLLESGVTDTNGALTFAKYEANGNKYKYYLVETQAPSGYNLLTEAVEVHFTDAEVEETAGIYTVKVPNNSGIQLPVTGGMGTVIFTVIGIALMAGALVLLVFSRKKATVNK